MGFDRKYQRRASQSLLFHAIVLVLTNRSSRDLNISLISPDTLKYNVCLARETISGARPFVFVDENMVFDVLLSRWSKIQTLPSAPLLIKKFT